MEKIVENGGDYVVTAKDYQPKPRAEIEAHSAERSERGRLTKAHGSNDGHGRHEERTVSVSVELRSLPIAGSGPGLASVARVERRSQLGDVERRGTTCLMSSLGERQATRLTEVTRAHWSIENTLTGRST